MSINKFNSICKSTRKERQLKRTIVKNIDELNNKNCEIKNLDYNLHYYKTYSESSYNYNVHLINLIHTQEKIIHNLKNQIKMFSNELGTETGTKTEETDYSYTKCTC